MNTADNCPFPSLSIQFGFDINKIRFIYSYADWMIFTGKESLWLSVTMFNWNPLSLRRLQMMGKKVHRRREVRRLLREELKKMDALTKQPPNEQISTLGNEKISL